MKKMIASMACCILLFCVIGYIIQAVFHFDTALLLQAGAVFFSAYVIAGIVLCISGDAKKRKNNSKAKENGENDS